MEYDDRYRIIVSLSVESVCNSELTAARVTTLRTKSLEHICIASKLGIARRSQVKRSRVEVGWCCIGWYWRDPGRVKSGKGRASGRQTDFTVSRLRESWAVAATWLDFIAQATATLDEPKL